MKKAIMTRRKIINDYHYKKNEEIHIVQDDFLLKQSRGMGLFYFTIFSGACIPIQTSIDNFSDFNTFFILALHLH